MAWVIQKGKSLKDIILLNNSEYVCTTTGSVRPNYTYITSPMYFASSGYNYSCGTYTPYIDLTKYKTISIKGVYSMIHGISSQGTVNASIVLTKRGGSDELLLFAGITWEQSSVYNSPININKNIESYTGEYQISVRGLAVDGNYTYFAFTEFSILK